MANTENIEAKLAAYVDNELDAAGRAEIEQHLAANPQHRALIQELRQTSDYLKAVPHVSAPPEIAEMLAVNLERAALLGDVQIGADTGATQFSRWPQFRAIAAVLILTCGLAFVLYKVLPSPKPSPTNVAIVTPETPPPSARRSPRPSEDTVAMDRAARGGAGEGATETRSGVADERRDSSANTTLGSPAPSGAVSRADELPTATENAVYLLVDTTNVASTNDQVVQYLAVNRINWQPVPASIAVRDPEVSKEYFARGPVSNAPPSTSPDNHAEVNSNIAESTANNAGPTSAPLDLNGVKDKQAAPAAQNAIVARMTREEAAQLSATLSQMRAPMQQQSAQILSPRYASKSASPTLDDRKPDAKGQDIGNQLAQLQNELQKPTTGPTTQPTEQAPPTTMPADKAADAKPATTPTDERALEPGETVRVRAREVRLPDIEPVDETLTIDADGNLMLPTVGRVQAAGVSPQRLAQSIPAAMEKSKGMSQSIPMELSWTIERVAQQSPPAPGAVAAPTTAPTPTGIDPLANGPTTTPTTEPASAARDIEEKLEADRAGTKLDVVILLRAVESPASIAPAPTTEPTTQPEPPTTIPTTSPDR